MVWTRLKNLVFRSPPPILAWRIPETEEVGGRLWGRTVGHDQSDLAAIAAAGRLETYF